MYETIDISLYTKQMSIEYIKQNIMDHIIKLKSTLIDKW